MAQTLITIDPRMLLRQTGKEGKLVRKYRALIMVSLAQAVDNIRRRAPDNIVKNVTGERNPYKAAKIQPAIPGKLTERTGLLIKMLIHKSKPLGGAWSVKPGSIRAGKTSKLTTNALKGQVKVSGGFGSFLESYLATLRVYIESGSPILNDKMARLYTGWVNTEQGRRRIPSQSKKQLAIRFQHETGIRGQKRPFIAPAAQNQQFFTTNIFKQKMAEIGGVI